MTVIRLVLEHGFAYHQEARILFNGKRFMVWPNVLTILRIALTPVIGGLLLGQHIWWAVIGYGLAALTDFADGFVATRWNARSVLGAALDPLADKILVLITLFFMAANHTLSSPWMLWPCALMMVRELGVLGLRSMLGSQALPVIPMAKLKTTLQMITLPVLMLLSLYGHVLGYLVVAYALLLLSTVFSFHSGWTYGVAAYRILASQNRESLGNQSKPPNPQATPHSAT